MMSYLSVQFRAVWHRLVHPKHETVHMFVIYCIAFITGAVSTIYPPQVAEIVLGQTWMLVCTVTIGIGGLMGMFGAPFGDRWAERPAILFIAGAILMYFFTIMEFQIYSDNSLIIHLGVVLLTFLFLSKRFWTIRNGRVDPLSTR